MSGGAISILSLWKVVDLAWGVPGRIDDSAMWRIWLDGMNPSDIIYPAGVVCGLALATSEWWYPRLRQGWHRAQDTSTALASPAEGLVRFKECLPQVERCQKLVGPRASPLGGLNMGIMQLHYLSTGDTTIIKLVRELEYLTRSLDALGIRCPNVYGGNDESDSDFRVRMRIWNMYLAELVVMISHDDLMRARQLEPLNSTKPPTSGKSDAQC